MAVPSADCGLLAWDAPGPRAMAMYLPDGAGPGQAPPNLLRLVICIGEAATARKCARLAAMAQPCGVCALTDEEALPLWRRPAARALRCTF